MEKRKNEPPLYRHVPVQRAGKNTPKIRRDAILHATAQNIRVTLRVTQFGEVL
jgi:hypothetical protein